MGSRGRATGSYYVGWHLKKRKFRMQISDPNRQEVTEQDSDK